MTAHELKNKFCAVCNQAKTQQKAKRKGQMDLGPKPLHFGDQLTADLLLDNKKNVKSTHDEYDEIDARPSFCSTSSWQKWVSYDRATNWMDCYPKATRSEEHIKEAMQESTKPSDKAKQFYCDNGGELEAASRT